MMTNKRGPEDMSSEIEQSPQSEHSPPKRSKLDFLAMIAELSEKKDEAAKEAPVTTLTETVEPSKTSESDSTFKKPASPKSEAPKSSFAAWKLAKGKGRKNASKSANRNDLQSVSTGVQPAEPKAEASAPPKLLPEATLPKENPLLAVLAAATPLPVNNKSAVTDGAVEMAATGSLPPKKTMKIKDPSSKKSVSVKKAGASAKKDGMSSKKALKKKGDGASKGSGKTKSKKGDQANGKAATFPEKIMELLQAGLAPNAIYWLPEGEAIAVDPDNFKDSNIISKQFRGNKLSSFVRSLNRWGFRRIFYHSLPDKTLAFYHRLFQKQSPALVKEMKMDGGEKEPELPQGAMAAAVTADGKVLVTPDITEKKPESPVSTQSVVSAPAKKPTLPTLPERIPGSPSLSASGVSAPAPAVLQAAIQAASKAAPAPAILPQEPVLSAPAPAVADVAQSLLDRSALERLAESQHALQLQQAMAAEQERSDMALQALQAQQLVLQSLADQQNVAHAEELLMQSMLAEQQRSEIALQQRQAEQALLQQMLAEQETAALAAALGGAGAGGLDAEALLRERLLLQHYGAAASPASAGSSDILALLQQQLQGGQQQAREPSYMEQLLLLEQQQQRQQEAALLAAHGFHFG